MNSSSIFQGLVRNLLLWGMLILIGLMAWLIFTSPSPQPARAAQSTATPSPEPTAQPPMAEVIIDSLPVRSCPAEACKEIETLSRGTQVEIIACLGDGSWCQVVLADGERGWSTSASLQQLAEVQPDSEEEAGPETELISVATDGTQGTSGGFPVEPQWRPGPSVSTDGRYVSFSTRAFNLAEDDTNDEEDIFVHDRQTGQTRLISITAEGTQANSWSSFPALSADGRYVVFSSGAKNLVENDANDSCNKDGYPTSSRAGIVRHCPDVFVYDLQLDQISRVSVASDGIEGNGASGPAAISGDGRFVAFWSKASNLVEADTNETDDVFVHDRQTGQTSRVSVASDGTEGNGFAQRSFLPWAGPPDLSVDGRYVAFWSDADNLVSGDTNQLDDVFVHDRQTGQTSRVSVASGGSQANGRSGWPAISADGRYVAFTSEADDLVDDDTNETWDIFVHDRQTEETRRISVDSDGIESDGPSDYPAISADGRYIAFSSEASNLVISDTNQIWDVFLHDQERGQTERLSISFDSSEGDAASFSPAISGDGRYVAFWSNAGNLVEKDTNEEADVFVHDRGSRASAPTIEKMTFASGATADNEPVDPGVTFETGITEIHVIFDYRNMSGDYTWERAWYLDGEEILRGSTPWTEAEQGRLDYTLDAGGDPLPAGAWLLEISVEDTLVATGTFTVTEEGAAQATPTPAPPPIPRTYPLTYSKWDGGFHNVYIADTNGQNERLLIKRAAAPSWSPDGEQLFFFGQQGVNQQYAPDGRLDCDFGTISDGIVALDIPPGNADICAVYYGSWKCERKSIDVQAPPSDVCEQDGYRVFQNLDWKEGTARWANVAPDGSAVAYDAKPGGTYRIYFRSIFDNAQYHFEILGEQADWSPDSQRLVYRSGRDDKQGLWISNRDDTNHVNITINGTDSFPAWSPDGRTIAFSREEAGNVDIYAVNVDGSNLRRLTDAPGPDTLPTFTPGGEIIFRSARSGSWGIWKMTGNGSNQREIIPNAGLSPDWAYGRMDVLR